MTAARLVLGASPPATSRVPRDSPTSTPTRARWPPRSVYTKLHAQSREEAVARAHDIELL